METVGFIGLGIMGRPMAANLVKGGFTVIGFDVMPQNCRDAEGRGVKIAASAAELASQCSIIIQMLPTPAICLESAAEIGKHAKPGTLVLDMSSLSPMTAQQIQSLLSEKGIQMMDAPVSGGEPKAIDATLAIMAGGSQEDYDRALPVFKPMSASTILVGKVGAGCIAKLANQIMVGVNIAAMGEAFTLAAKAGVDPGLVFEAVKNGLAGSTVLNQKGPMILERNYTPGARMEIHIKDFVNVLDTAHSMSSPVPLTASVMEMMQSLKANGMGQIDHGGVVRFYELIAGVEVKKG
jgi:2-hydroxy-3-oxopropionate reductase